MNCDGNSDGLTPYIGMQFESENDAYIFYNNYGRYLGFGIRRDYHVKSRTDKVIISRKFVYCKEGKKETDKWGSKSRHETRTDCPTHMHISLNRDVRKFVVIKMDVNHNHLMHLPECAHMLLSQLKLGDT